MIKRLFDIALAGILLVVSSPLWALTAIGIKASSPGPIFYSAARIGRGGRPFRMLKFRTMTVGTSAQSEITAPRDNRVFPFGRLLRLLKIDELPQLLNILRGQMSIVGPRPESQVIVAQHYTDWMRETLTVAPGLTSVGAVFGYAYGDELIDSSRPEESYVARMLPAKLALERAYLERATFGSDLATMVRTASAVLAVPLGIRVAPPLRDLRGATQWVDASLFPTDLNRGLAELPNRR